MNRKEEEKKGRRKEEEERRKKKWLMRGEKEKAREQERGKGRGRRRRRPMNEQTILSNMVSRIIVRKQDTWQKEQFFTIFTRGQRASNSSKKITHGALALALENT